MITRLLLRPALLCVLASAMATAGTDTSAAPPAPDLGSSGGGGRKISVNLTGESARVIDRIRGARGLSTTQVVRRGLHLLDWFDRNSGDQVVFGVSRDGGKTFREVEFIGE